MGWSSHTVSGVFSGKGIWVMVWGTNTLIPTAMGIVEKNSRLANYYNTVTILNSYKNIHNKLN
jgi:hypothetical protein